VAKLPQSPADLVIRPRDIAFGRTERHARWWLNGDPVATHFANAMSMTFPQGERFFMDAVRHYRDAVPDEMKPQVAAFLTQEAIHSREHLAFNRQVSDNGYDISVIDYEVKRRLDLTRRLPPAVQLSVTIALEHFTAIMAHQLLGDPVYMAGASPEAARMWRWHGMEELEHKAVAYDTYMHAMGRIGPVRRWLLRSLIMFIMTFLFFGLMFKITGLLYKQDGINTPKTWWKTLKYMFGHPGIFRRVAGPYFRYYRPGFHPWQEDDRRLLSAAQAEFDEGHAVA